MRKIAGGRPVMRRSGSVVLAVAAALLVVVGAAVGIAQGKGVPGIFEAQMVDVNTGNGNVTVAKSEGEIKIDGTFKVEIPGVPAGDYKVCLFYDGGSNSLGAVSLLATGELELTGDLTPSPLASGTVLVNPEFRVYSGGTAGTCDGTLEFRSGGTVN